MPKDNQTINRSLFDLLDSKGYEPTMLDTSGKAVPIPEEAEVFQFDFIKDGKDYGPVTITIDGLHRLIIYYGKGVADSAKEQTASGDESWYSLLRHLKRWAKNNQLSFELNYDRANKLKYDMAKRDHMKRKEKDFMFTFYNKCFNHSNVLLALCIPFINKKLRNLYELFNKKG